MRASSPSLPGIVVSVFGASLPKPATRYEVALFAPPAVVYTDTLLRKPRFELGVDLSRSKVLSYPVNRPKRRSLETGIGTTASPDAALRVRRIPLGGHRESGWEIRAPQDERLRIDAGGTCEFTQCQRDDYGNCLSSHDLILAGDTDHSDARVCGNVS